MSNLSFNITDIVRLFVFDYVSTCLMIDIFFSCLVVQALAATRDSVFIFGVMLSFLHRILH